MTAGRPVTPDVSDVRPRVLPGWQSLAAEQLDGHEPVFAYGAGPEQAGTLRPLASRAELVAPASEGRVATPWGSLPLGVTRSGGEGAALVGALRPRTSAGDRGLVQQALMGRGLPPRLASRAASLLGGRADPRAALALPTHPAARTTDVVGSSGVGAPSWSGVPSPTTPGGRTSASAASWAPTASARPLARPTGAPASVGGPEGAPDQVLLGLTSPASAAAGFGGAGFGGAGVAGFGAPRTGRALDPAQLGLLGQGPRARGESGLGWLGGRTTQRMSAPVGRDVAGALPAPLREFVHGGAAPTSTLRLVTAPEAPAVAAARAPQAATAASPPAPALERDDELVRPVAPVQMVSPSPTPVAPGAPSRAEPMAEAQAAAPARSAARRVGAPRRASSSRRVDMETTNLVAGVAGGGVLRKLDAVDADAGGDKGEPGPSRESSSTEAAVPAQPADLSLLVNQIYAQLKRELMIERERKG